MLTRLSSRGSGGAVAEGLRDNGHQRLTAVLVRKAIDGGFPVPDDLRRALLQAGELHAGERGVARRWLEDNALLTEVATQAPELTKLLGGVLAECFMLRPGPAA